MNNLNTSIYTVKSKVGTNFEEQNEVEMPMMEAYDILMNIEYPTREKITDVLYTINGKEISVKNISSIRYNRRTRKI